VREGEAVNARAREILAGPGPFADRLVRSCITSVQDIKQSRYLHLLFDHSEETPNTASAFEAFRDLTERNTKEYIEAAMEAGEVRDDLSAEAIIRWTHRVFVMLVADPPGPDEGNFEDVLRRFVLPSIAPQ
jgi:hypothetical protein